MTQFVKRAAIVVVLFLLPALKAPAQSLFATLTGVVSDPSGAVVPNATVKLINEQSADTRSTVTNGDGYFTFASIAVGNFTYKLTVEATGFSTYQATGLSILGGEKRNINVALRVGKASQTVEVTGYHSTRGFRREVGNPDYEGTFQLHTGRQQRGGVSQDHAGFGINNATSNFGIATDKQGFRVIQLAVKFMF